MAETRDLVIVAKIKDEMSGKLKETTNVLNGLKKAAAVVGIAALGKQMITAASEMEQLNVSFKTLLGSADEADIFTKKLQDLAARTPMETTDLAKASQTLLAFGMDAESIIPSLQMIGDVSLGNSQKFASLSLAFAQVQSTGRLMGQDLLQMINQGFNPLQIISEQTGKSMAQLKEEMSAGAISAKAVAEAFKVATSEGGRFYGGMDAQSKTLAGAISTLKDNFNLFLAEAGKPFADMLKTIVIWLSNVINKALEFYKAHKQVIDIVVQLVAAFGATYLILTKVVGALSLAKTAVNLLSGAVKVFMSHPILILLSLAAAGVVYLADKFGGLKNAFLVIGSAFAILGNLVVIGLKEMANSVIKFVNKALNVGNKIYNFFSNLLAKVGVDIGTANMSIDFEFDEAKNTENINSMLTMMDNMKIEASSKKEQSNQEIAGLYEADLSAFNSTEGAKSESGKNAAKSISEAYKKMGEEFQTVMEETRKSMDETGKKIMEISKKIEELNVGYAEDTLNSRQSYAEAYVEQEQKVASLLTDWQTESDQDKKNSLFSEYQYNLDLLNQKKTIELAYQNEVNEARRRASLSDFERKLEDLENSRTLIELEYQEKLSTLNNELKAEQEKYKVLSTLQEWAVKEADKYLAQQEKQTLNSVNKQVEYYNRLAEAVKNAQQGNYTSYASLARGTNERATSSNVQPNVNITVNGDVSGEELVGKVSEKLMSSLRLNGQVQI